MLRRLLTLSLCLAVAQCQPEKLAVDAEALWVSVSKQKPARANSSNPRVFTGK